MGQSSNDVFPTATQVAALDAIEHDLVPALEGLQRACEAKARELWDVVKTGRTHLQDATPIRLGQEFLGYAGQAERAIRRLRFAQAELREVQPGSSSMPGKVNPVIAEALTMVCSQVIGNHVAITLAGQSGNFELNVQQTVAAHNLIESIALLARATENFTRQCLQG